MAGGSPASCDAEISCGPTPGPGRPRRVVAGARIARQQKSTSPSPPRPSSSSSTTSPTRTRRRFAPGPFTVEILSPHRMLGVDEHDELIDIAPRGEPGPRRAPVVPADDREPGRWPAFSRPITRRPDCLHGAHALAGRDDLRRGPLHGGRRREARAIFIGPEFGTVQRADLVQPPREKPATRASMS